ncbi:SOS response-associated peptidase family protein [Mesorhizobium sp. M5C.F.Cr.IN.023.01.1.1]|uniref:SOS response-associated peptidase family protein n=1 Tax=Mesorhizobium sp. M5C.F.Cr.IN.023.01.1.1 TaxID=2496768 RepID=UPI002479C050|nr:SOS response-associated peptidase family protein [Mesorhizobium sp. M5C.F.Cr.IN.023.01.1.1]
MVSLHDRQPVILAPEVYDAWLDPRTPGGEAKALLSHDLDDQLQFYRVDRQVNSSKNKGGDEMITPIDMRTAYGI